MKKLLIISPTQFGYHTDPFAYCKHLKKLYEIEFICFDQQLPKLELEHVNVCYIPLQKNKISHWLNYFRSSISAARSNSGITFVVYFRFCFLIKLLNPGKSIILDIRTGNLYNNAIKQWFFNRLIKFESTFFKTVTIITEGLKSHLNINKKCFILPLGADPIDHDIKNVNGIQLIYIGTFDNRNMEVTLEGFKFFLEKKGYPKDCIYRLIGYASADTIALLKDIIKKNELQGHVQLLGRVKYSELNIYLKQSNIGVAYVPLKKYYQFQPLTKLFEYLLAGIPCIASNTYENAKIINSGNGAIIKNNTKEDFSDALVKLSEQINTYNSLDIQNNIHSYSWEHISHKILKPILEYHV